MTGEPALEATPEMKLLLQCARPQITQETSAQILHLVQAGLDWDHLLHLAGHHRMKPLLYWRLNEICPSAVSELVLQQLRNEFLSSTRHNMFLLQRLVALLNLLDAHQIMAVPYKGPVLTAIIYKNLALRSSGDLDVVVHKREIPHITQLLLENGYWTKLTEKEKRLLLRKSYHYRFREQSLCIEIHWAFAELVNNLQLTLEDMESRLVTFPIAGKQIPSFVAEDLLLLLCVHGGKHFWDRLIWICDIAWLLSRYPSLDWEQLIQRATDLGVRRMLFLGIMMAHTLLDTPLPRNVLEQIWADAVVVLFAARLQERFFMSQHKPPGQTQFLYFYLLRERSRDKLIYSYRSFLSLLEELATPTERDYAVVSLPEKMSFLYYLLRPARLLYNYDISVSYILKWFDIEKK